MSTSSDHTDLSPQQSLDASSSSPSPRSASDGRQLPSIPSQHQQPQAVRPSHSQSVGSSNTLGNNKASNSVKGSNGYGPFFQEYSLMAEYNQVHHQNIPGLYAMPSSKSPLIWSGLIFIRQGLYQGAALRFTLTIPHNYPDGTCPTLVFEHPVFHPLVDPETGELDVKRAFPRWRRNVNHLWQVLLFAKKVFYNIDTKMPSNPEAAVLYEQEPELFKCKVTESLDAAKERLYQPPSLDDPFALRFSPWNEAVHPESRRQMVQTSKKFDGDNSSANPSDLGLSWMDPTDPQIFATDNPGAG